MPDFACTVCGEAFTLPQEVVDRYPGWKPRFCRAHSPKRAEAGGKGRGGGQASGGGKARGGQGLGGQGRGGQGRGGQGRGGSAREENLQLADVFLKYRDGPQTGVFTDGSCSPNPGRGGWGVAWLQDGVLIKQAYGETPDTTNNRMELLALIEALKLLPESTEITVYTDSQLCANTVNEWAAGWARRGWKRKAGPIKNLELVQELYALKQLRPNVTIAWIAAHSGYLGNELADSLATAWMRSEL